MKLKYETAEHIKSYEDSVMVAFQTRTDRTIENIKMRKRDTIISTDAPLNDEELDILDDILAATERHRVEADGNTVIYRLQRTADDDTSVPTGHELLEDRVALHAGDGNHTNEHPKEHKHEVIENGTLGHDKGELPPENIDVVKRPHEIVVEVPDNIDEKTVSRIDHAMLSYGKLRTEE